MEENNNVYEGTNEELVTNEVVDESLALQEEVPFDDLPVYTPKDESSNDALGKAIFGIGTIAVGAGVAYVVKNRKEIKKAFAMRKKAKAQKGLDKQARKLAEANAVLNLLEEPKEVSETCEAVTVTTTE